MSTTIKIPNLLLRQSCADLLDDVQRLLLLLPVRVAVVVAAVAVGSVATPVGFVDDGFHLDRWRYAVENKTLGSSPGSVLLGNRISVICAVGISIITLFKQLSNYIVGSFHLT